VAAHGGDGVSGICVNFTSNRGSGLHPAYHIWTPSYADGPM
jgi:hypothetical protein